jgi:hypothetical protein
MLRNKKYGMGGAVQSFSSPMLAVGMQGSLSGFGTSGLQTFAKGGVIIDQYEGRTPEDIWFALTKNQRRHLLLDHANIPSGETTMYIGYDTKFEDLPHFIKQIVKKHFAEGQYAKGGQMASIGDSGIITDKKSMFVGKMALITGDLGNMYEVRVGGRTTIVKKNGIKIIPDEETYYADGGEIYKLAEEMSDADFEKEYDSLSAKEKNSVKSLIRLGDDKKLALATILAKKNDPRQPSKEYYRRAYEYADGGKTRKSGNVPRIAKKVAEVNALIEKGNQLGLEVVDSSTTWQAPMKYKPIKYVNGILYIEYEELDLYLNNRKGINQWKLKKDKVLKRNMEFDNPLNDIAKMYRKAIRDREQYFANGGAIEYRFASARTMGRDSQNWEQKLKEYAGEHYKNLTLREREAIIADMQNDYDRNTHFAKGGKVTHLPQAKNISEKEKRATYVLAFGQEYDAENRGRHPLPLDIAYQVALHSLERKRKKMAKGGKISSYEVELEAVPNSDYDQYSHRASLRVKKTKKSVKSIEEAVKIAKNFIDENDLGGGNFLPAKIYKNGKHIGFISYNGRVWNNDQSEMKYAEGGEIKPKRSKITLIMDGKSYSYPVAIVNGRVETTEETFKDGVVREYLDKEFDLWLDQAPSDYEEMYYGDESIMSKRGAIEGAMEIVISTIEEEAPRKTTFNFDEGDVEFYEAYQYARGGSIEVGDAEKSKSLKGNLKIKF